MANYLKNNYRKIHFNAFALIQSQQHDERDIDMWYVFSPTCDTEKGWSHRKQGEELLSSHANEY